MSFISPIPTNPDGSERQTGSMQSLGKDDFLNLLVTKLEHQDPLKPMQDEDFVAQLAQFSSLEQMNRIAEEMASSNEWDMLQTQSLNNAMAAGFIGKEVKADYDGLYYDGETDPQLTYRVGERAASVTLTIKDSDGQVVRTLNEQGVEVGTHRLNWDGRDARGNQVDSGPYSVEATAVDANGNEIKPKLSLVGPVDSVIYRNGNAYLRVKGMEVALGDVTTVGEPGLFTGDN
jgi:flagellar basal-body rod modification protein FlgD